MSQHRAIVDGKEWMYGFDNPCGGYFATRFLSDEEAEETGEEADVLIGFGRGVNLETLISECTRHGLCFTVADVEQLRKDKEQEEGPLGPMQEWALRWAQEAGVFDD